MKVIAEYLWMDGVEPTAGIRGKPRILELDDKITLDQLTSSEGLTQIPPWGFDGSSTEQAPGDKSDCVLKPVRVYLDPIRTRVRPDYLSVLVLNEVMLVSGQPHPSNTRAPLRVLADEFASQEFWFGLEQELTFLRAATGRPLGFPEQGLPGKQGPYYCGVGVGNTTGRQIMERHLFACLDAGLVIAGGNAEVMPEQWEWQMGNATPASNPLRVADDSMIARYLVARIAEEYSVIASLAAKPEKDWNGAGMHTNFSTKEMREGTVPYKPLIARFRAKHKEHIAVYGDGIQQRLTGAHETCSYRKFREGLSDRGASIRRPLTSTISHDGLFKGYLEDRRPCANADPYVVEAMVMKTVMEK